MHASATILKRLAHANLGPPDRLRQVLLRVQVSAASIDEGKTAPEVIYDGNTVSHLKAPGGVAMDNYFVYWLNKAGAPKAGTLIRGLQYATAETIQNASAGVKLLAGNAPKCYGVCLAGGNIFYTDEASRLYGINRASTSRHVVRTISSSLQAPRGCVSDGAGTVYVADKSQNAVFRFPSNMDDLMPRAMVKAADLQGAFGLAIHDVGYQAPGILR
ncbi:unnamed protein product [Symbiodinium necroappetens]|uniref:Uncharacterized protein n=1 Tax=Symbiodinium necroappetens TaxID=1628268 RepID=A0A812PDY0_9DINO|nr:unnamed protein product [Symbiodinium necroappetens]